MYIYIKLSTCILMSNNCTGKHLTMYKRMQHKTILQTCVKKTLHKLTMNMIWSKLHHETTSQSTFYC